MMIDRLMTRLRIPLAIAIGVCSFPWWLTVAAMLVHADGAFFAFIIGPIMLLALALLPAVSMAEMIWFGHFIYAGGSLFDQAIRKDRGKEYRLLFPHFAAVGLLIASLQISHSAGFRSFAWSLGRLTTDEELIQHFQAHRREFERLGAISGDAERNRAEIALLADKLELEDVRGPRLYAYSDGWALAHFEKGYVRSPVPLSPIVESLDGSSSAAGVTRYRRIDEMWYLFQHDD